jgi:hypothetical protein
MILSFWKINFQFSSISIISIDAAMKNLLRFFFNWFTRKMSQLNEAKVTGDRTDQKENENNCSNNHQALCVRIYCHLNFHARI